MKPGREWVPVLDDSTYWSYRDRADNDRVLANVYQALKGKHWMVWVPLGEYTLEKFKNLRTAAEFAIDQIRVE
jgi:hypothetical protein